jgi:excinuclease ABC subunit C
MNTELEDKRASLPNTPGVYLMKDAKGRILYVGKARDLKKRVCSYFRKAARRDLKTRVLIEKIRDFDTIITNTEKEALLLESNLIKRHHPRYNVILKDDKRYPCLRLDMQSPYPNLTIARKIQKDGAMYFGPFASAGAVRETLKVIRRTFKLRKCKGKSPKGRDRPCLNYQMGLCLGPCSLPVDPMEYKAIVDEVVLFLKGRTPELIERARKAMETAAAQQDFEAAAECRDRLLAFENTLEKQVATTADFADRDVIGFARKERAVLIMVFFVRGGFLLGNLPFFVPEALPSDDEVIASFVKQYYENAPFVPKEVLLPCVPEDQVLLEEWLGELKGEKVYILVPQRGEKAKLLGMASRNAKKGLDEKIHAVMAEASLLDRVQKRLALTRRPERIECFDLSNVAGAEGVGAMVVFENGRPCPQAYRKYKMKMAPGKDDYAMLREALSRRYKEGDTQQTLPDLLVVDGGKGQLNVAIAVLRDCGLWGGFDLIGIAKKDPQRGETDDKTFKPGRKNPVNLRKAPEVLLFLQRIRDEAHRHVITFHRKRRMMTYRKSALEKIPGIGSKRRAQLLRHFGSLKRIKNASLEEILAVPGMTRKAAQALFEALGESSQETGVEPKQRTDC